MSTFRILIYIWAVISIINLVIVQIYGLNNFEKMYEERNLDAAYDDETKHALKYISSIAGSVSTFAMVTSILPVVHLITIGIFIVAICSVKFGEK